MTNRTAEQRMRYAKKYYQMLYYYLPDVVVDGLPTVQLNSMILTILTIIKYLHDKSIYLDEQ
jgi:hypothetical protein